MLSRTLPSPATRRPGDPATVILGVDGQSAALLAALAREFPHAEVAFVLPPTGTDHDLTVRFFNARKEAPFVGHARLAVHAVLLAERAHFIGRQGRHFGRPGRVRVDLTSHAVPWSAC